MFWKQDLSFILINRYLLNKTLDIALGIAIVYVCMHKHWYHNSNLPRWNWCNFLLTFFLWNDNKHYCINGENRYWQPVAYENMCLSQSHSASIKERHFYIVVGVMINSGAKWCKIIFTLSLSLIKSNQNRVCFSNIGIQFHILITETWLMKIILKAFSKPLKRFSLAMFR